MARLERAKVYRNIELRQQWFGLEPFDAIGLGFLAGILMFLNGDAFGWNLLTLVLGYAGLRIAKRGKPEGYTTTLVRHYLRRPFFSAGAEDGEGRRHPFPCSPTHRPERMVRTGFAAKRPLGAVTEGEIP